MSKREPFATKVDSELRATLNKLSEVTRIPQSKLVDEALEDLFKKYAGQLKKQGE